MTQQRHGQQRKKNCIQFLLEFFKNLKFRNALNIFRTSKYKLLLKKSSKKLP